MATVKSKACSACKQTLPATAFTADRRASTGLQPRCKPCVAAAAKAKRYKDIESHRAQARAYYAANVDHLREQAGGYRAAHTEKIKARAKAYYRLNRERHIEWVRQNRKANPERTRELARGWQATRRALKRGGVTAVQQAAWVATQKKVCHWCGRRCGQEYEIDHIQPLSRGGRHELSNLAISCRPCNRSKSAADPIEWAQSLGKLL